MSTRISPETQPYGDFEPLTKKQIIKMTHKKVYYSLSVVRLCFISHGTLKGLHRDRVWEEGSWNGGLYEEGGKGGKF